MGGTCPGRTRAPLALRTVASRERRAGTAPDQRAARKGPGPRREMTWGGRGSQGQLYVLAFTARQDLFGPFFFDFGPIWSISPVAPPGPAPAAAPEFRCRCISRRVFTPAIHRKLQIGCWASLPSATPVLLPPQDFPAGRAGLVPPRHTPLPRSLPSPRASLDRVPWLLSSAPWSWIDR